jgi:16S rRNA (cytidine1402-2'-O)-methyltransferase
MTTSGTGDRGSEGPRSQPDPEILEELEFWIGPDDLEVGETAGERDQRPEARADGERGSLVLVGTPIGNLGDLAPRAVAALEQADVIYCEDTRHSRKLLTHAGITGASLRSLHEHNELDRVEEVVGSVAAGRTVAVISDAGMPGISDPGSRVVAAAAEAGLTVTVVPGASSVLAALVTSGLATDRFCFEGFLPRSGKERRQRLAAVADESRTTVLFEAPGRVATTLGDLAGACGGTRRVSVARELTKLHEEIWRGPLDEAVVWAESSPLRGEVVLVLAGAPLVAAVVVGDEVLKSALVDRLSAGERTRGVVDEVAAQFDVPRRRVYELALAVRELGIGSAGPAVPAPPREAPREE